MTNTTPLPEPNYVPGGIDSEQDLRSGADDGPDILQGVAEDEPDLESVIKHDAVPFRTPVAGQRLTEEQLEHDID
jgi:hypothetical protein